MELGGPFSFTKNCKLMKIKGRTYTNPHKYGNLLFDLRLDPGQENAIVDPEIEARMIRLMQQLMRDNDAPPEQYDRLGIL
jgi:hypothetical protein